MEKDGVTAEYDALLVKAPSIPFLKSQSLSINDYVISKALDGGVGVAAGSGAAVPRGVAIPSGLCKVSSGAPYAL